MNRLQLQIEPGKPLPLGVRECRDGFNFSLFSRNAEAVFLELYERSDDAFPLESIALDPAFHRTGDLWHIKVRGISCGQMYAYRVHGPYEPEGGHRFNSKRLLLDPYAVAVVGTDHWDFELAQGYTVNGTGPGPEPAREDNAQTMPKCLVMGSPFDWQNDHPLKHPWENTIIYETHIRGLTIHPSSGVRNPGTFLGLIEKIPYLKKLGITALELMPVQEFNENEIVRTNPLTGERLKNYWGYNTASFFAPKEAYAADRSPGGQVNEFKLMVRELHKAGIEVILDVVFNHTAEGNGFGPTLNFRGLDNSIYYMLEPGTHHYRNYSGCGNTLNCSHPVVRTFIMDCLRYWVMEMHVDGFRFDLASVLGRDANGEILSSPPLLERIAEDPLLRDTKLIAEAWDAGGAYQVGSFPGQRWSEWNGKFRDEVRQFWRGDKGMVGKLATRICGSSDLYERSGKAPLNSINFVTCHDGFTLQDLVSYAQKHNESNGEDNEDGANDNLSNNYGVEGETRNSSIRSLRLRQVKNLMATLLLSRGVPMLLGGDEMGRTQRGNNNAYCQDNAVSWYDWRLLSRNREIYRFTRQMIAFRNRQNVLRSQRFFTDNDVLWFGPYGNGMAWDQKEHALGCMIYTPEEGSVPSQFSLCFLMNAGEEAKAFKLPSIPGAYEWRLFVDTSKSYPGDVMKPGTEIPLLARQDFLVTSRSMAILIAMRKGSRIS